MDAPPPAHPPRLPGEEPLPGDPGGLELARLRLRERFLTRLAEGEAPHDLLATLCRELHEQFAAPCAVLERAAAPRLWELRASAGMSPELADQLADERSRPHLTRLGWRNLQRGPLRVPDPSQSPFLRVAEEPLDLEAELWIQPCLSRASVVTGAVLAVLPRGRELDPIELAQARAAAELAGLALERLHEEQPERTPALAEGVLDGVTALLMVLDRDGVIVQVNRAFERCFGHEREELLGHPLAKLLAGRGDTSLEHWLEAVAQGTDGLQYEGRWRTVGGRERLVGWVASGLRDPAGRLRFFVCTGADITDRRRAEREREQVQQALLHLQKMEAIEVLVNGFVHDFNNNLTAIIGFADLAQASVSKDHPAQRSLEEVLNAAKLATSLTRSLLTFTRSAGTHQERNDLREVLETGAQLLRHSLPRSIQLDVSLAVEGPLEVKADPSQIQQILIALAINARDAMPRGGRLEVRVEAREKVDLPGGPGPAFALIVGDDGHGIPPEIRSRVFQPFFSTKLKGRGSGLGLPGVAHIVREHGGRIELDSVPGQGTAVTVFLPRASEAPRAEKGLAQARGPLSAPPHVLVADADGLSRSVIVSTLRQAELEVEASASLTEALRSGLLAPERFDLVLADSRHLPEDAEELLSELWRRSPRTRVLILGSGQEAPASNDRRMGTIERPFAMGELTRRVREHLLQEEGTTT